MIDVQAIIYNVSIRERRGPNDPIYPCFAVIRRAIWVMGSLAGGYTKSVFPSTAYQGVLPPTS